jgi:hypothetical protein
MEKKKYLIPVIEVLQFEATETIITASGGEDNWEDD